MSRKDDPSFSETLVPDQAELRRLVEQLPVGVNLWKLDDPEDPGSLRLIETNAAAEQAAGEPLKRFLGTTVRESFPGALESGVARAHVEAIERGEAVELPEFDSPPTGDLPGGRYRARAVPLGGGYVASVHENLTERRRVERDSERGTDELEQRVAAKTAELEVYHEVFERIPIGLSVMRLDDRGDPGSLRFVHSNARPSEIAGYDVSQHAGRTMAEVAPEAVRYGIARRYADAVLRAETVDLGEFPYQSSRVGAGYFRSAAFPLPDDHVGVVNDDVTARKRAEDEVRRLNEELNHHVAELERANADLEAFAYSIGHDLRAPLRAVQGLTLVLLEDHGDHLGDVGRERAERIAAAAARLGGLIRDLLIHGSIGRSELRIEPVELAEAVALAVSDTAAEREEAEADVDIAEPLPTVLADRSLLVPTVTNLLTNALKFVAAGVQPKVRVHAEARDCAVRLCVEDNGIGIAPEHHERVFGVFERLHGREQFTGTGIGLAVVRKSLRRMGGDAGVESAVGKGSRFWIELPAVDEEDDGDGRAADPTGRG